MVTAAIATGMQMAVLLLKTMLLQRRMSLVMPELPTMAAAESKRSCNRDIALLQVASNFTDGS